MELGLKDKVAVVTGASTGIGRATVLLLAAEGAAVVGASRRAPETLPTGVSHVETDLAAPGAPEALVGQALDRHGRLDVLVNNAAVGTLSAGFADATPESWEATLRLNLLAAVATMRAALPHLERSAGVIVNVTSVNGRLPASEGPAYSASKAALLNVSKAVATEYAGRGVRVVVVSPGLTATPMWLGTGGVAEQLAARSEGTAEEVTAAAAAAMPLGRFLEPEEVARCICFVASPAASGLTGTELVVDGGLTPTM